MKKRNYWKIATFILGVIFVFLFIISITNQKEKKEMMNFGEIQIPKSVFYKFMNMTGNDSSQIICSIQDKKCVKINKIN